MPALYWVFILAALEGLAFALFAPKEGLAVPLASLLYSWTPAFVGLFFARREGVRFPVFGEPNRYWALALLLPPLLAALSVLLALPLGTWRGVEPVQGALGHGPSGPAFWLYPAGYGLLVSLSVGLVFALGGEIFWRGYLWERFREQGFWPASLALGALWGFWQLPSLLAGGTPAAQVFFTLVLGVLLAPGLILFREWGRAVAPAALFLSGVRVWSFLPSYLVEGPAALVGFYGLSGVAALALFNLLLRRWVR